MSTIDQLQTALVQRLAHHQWARPRVSMLLGTDEHIGHETRVALTPSHIHRLRLDLESTGLQPKLYVVAGAGERARASDQEYRDARAQVLELDQLAEHGPFDLVHALKEPTGWEAELPGPFLRLGALHLASKPPAVCQLLRRRNFSAILDGGTVGGCAYLSNDIDRTPIVASMSRFAGSVAGEKLLEGVTKNGLGSGRVVVVGGGIAGFAAIRELPKETELVVVECFQAATERLAGELEKLGYSRVTFATELTEEAIDDAIGIVFAHRSGASAAEKVCDFDHHIRRMRRGAAVIDIAIDQGGSIRHADYDEHDDIATGLAKYRRLLDSDYFYYAETNMPRERPRQASRTHGLAAMPYLLMLLAFCAIHGGPAEATRALLDCIPRVYRDPRQTADFDLFDSLLQDLRNGLQLAVVDGHSAIVHPDIEENEVLASWVLQCAGR